MKNAVTPLRLVFMGTPDFAVPALAALLAAGHAIVAVYTQPPRPAGRGLAERRSPIHRLADESGLAVRTPNSLKEPAAAGEFATLAADAAVVAAYGLILPPPVLEAPRLGCINIHASLLPRWRGAAPIQHAIMAGDRDSGITIMQMDAGLDTGPQLLRRAIPITDATTGGGLHDSLAELGAELILQTLDGVAAGELTATPQPHAGVTYAAKLSSRDCRLDWSRPAIELDRQVRALCPAPGAWCEIDGARVKVLQAGSQAIASAGAAPGTVLDDSLTIACGAGALRLCRVQKAGRKAMTAAAFLRGNSINRGTILA